MNHNQQMWINRRTFRMFMKTLRVPQSYEIEMESINSLRTQKG
jgi:hypothetical protein